MEYEDFLSASVNGAIWPCSWLENVSSWTIAGKSMYPSFEVVRYEDLRNGKYSAIESLASGLEIENKDRLLELVLSYDFRKMKDIENGIDGGGVESKKLGDVGVGAPSEDMRKVTDSFLLTEPGYLKVMQNLNYN